MDMVAMAVNVITETFPFVASRIGRPWWSLMARARMSEDCFRLTRTSSARTASIPTA